MKAENEASARAASHYRAGLDEMETAQHWFDRSIRTIKGSDLLSDEDLMHLANLREALLQTRLRMTALTPDRGTR